MNMSIKTDHMPNGKELPEVAKILDLQWIAEKRTSTLTWPSEFMFVMHSSASAAHKQVVQIKLRIIIFNVISRICL